MIDKLSEVGYIASDDLVLRVIAALATKPVAGAFLFGPAGCGKSALPQALAKILDREVKMKIHLMNSAMMPEEGLYHNMRISHEQFKQFLVDAYEGGRLKSYIGYEQNLKFIAEWCDIRLPINRETVFLKDGDVMLVMRLKYRLQDVSAKTDLSFQKKLTSDDFEFFVVKFTKVKINFTGEK